MAQFNQIGSSETGFIQANGLNMYYEEYGHGHPVILLHGGTLTSASWGPQIPTLAQHFRVITPDSRGHGKTDNPSSKFSYRLMADDVAAFIQALNIYQPIVVGYSDGGQVALELGMRYPQLVRGLAVGATWFKFSESYLATLRHMGMERPGVVDIMQTETAMSDLIAMWQSVHARGSDYWKTLLLQLSYMWLTPLNYTTEDFARVVTPTLIVVGDRDTFVPVEEAAEMYRLIPHAALAVVPSADHGLPFTHADLFAQLVLAFLLQHSTETIAS